MAQGTLSRYSVKSLTLTLEDMSVQNTNERNHAHRHCTNRHSIPNTSSLCATICPDRGVCLKHQDVECSHIFVDNIADNEAGTSRV